MLAAAILGSSMEFIDGSVVNVALPAIQADLSALLPQMQWVVNSYMLILASLILIGGVAGESFMRQIAADDGYSKNTWIVNGLVSLAPRDLIPCSGRPRDYPNRLVSFTCGLRLLYYL